MASNNPTPYPPPTSGGLPYPPAGSDSSGALPYPPTDTLPYPAMDSALPYPSAAGPTTANVTNSPSHQSTGSNKNEPIENKTYTDAPPPYSAGGAPPPYPPTGAPGQMPPPQPGFVAYPAQPMSYPPPPGTVTVTRTVQSTGQVVVGNCPSCRVGMLSENFTLLGICCAFWFFPLGLICCLAMREKRCTSCGAVFA